MRSPMYILYCSLWIDFCSIALNVSPSVLLVSYQFWWSIWTAKLTVVIARGSSSYSHSLEQAIRSSSLTGKVSACLLFRTGSGTAPLLCMFFSSPHDIQNGQKNMTGLVKFLNSSAFTDGRCVLVWEGDGSDIQSALAEWTGQHTVPNVFIGGKHIGGCDSEAALDFSPFVISSYS